MHDKKYNIDSNHATIIWEITTMTDVECKEWHTVHSNKNSSEEYENYDDDGWWVFNKFYGAKVIIIGPP